jgi:hypothetical protein
VNWPLIFREVCEAYMGVTPLDLEQMHLDQLYLMTCDKKDLQRVSRTRRMTPQEARAEGFLPKKPGKSYVQRVREHIAAERAKKQKRARRRKRRQAAQNTDGL